MATKKKKIGSAGRFGAGYGKPKERLVAIEKIQRKRQECPFCHKRAKRQAYGIWACTQCGKKFAGPAYHL